MSINDLNFDRLYSEVNSSCWKTCYCVELVVPCYRINISNFLIWYKSQTLFPLQKTFDGQARFILHGHWLCLKLRIIQLVHYRTKITQSPVPLNRMQWPWESSHCAVYGFVSCPRTSRPYLRLIHKSHMSFVLLFLIRHEKEDNFSFKAKSN